MVSIFKMQANTKINAVASIYGIKIMENIDKISYDDVNEDKIDVWRANYQIPYAFTLTLETQKYNEADTVKKITLTINYTYAREEQTIVLEKLKFKEL